MMSVTLIPISVILMLSVLTLWGASPVPATLGSLGMVLLVKVQIQSTSEVYFSALLGR